jgi:hypothetical protein
LGAVYTGGVTSCICREHSQKPHDCSGCGGPEKNPVRISAKHLPPFAWAG